MYVKSFVRVLLLMLVTWLVGCTAVFDTDKYSALSAAMSKYSDKAHFVEVNEPISVTSLSKLKSKSSLDMSYKCNYDFSIDGQVSSSRSCNEIEGFSFNNTSGDYYWQPSIAQVGDYEFRVDIELNQKVTSKIFKVYVKNTPVISLKNDSGYLTGEDQPNILFNDFLTVGDEIKFFKDSSCTEVIAQSQISNTQTYRTLSTQKFNEGTYSIYMKAKIQGIEMPCLDTGAKHTYKGPRRTVKIYSNDSAFAALKEDGSVETWGGSGGNSMHIRDKLSSGVEEIFSNTWSFAALKADGSVVVWGHKDYGGDATGVDLSSGVVEITATHTAFAARKTDGSVVTWGRPNSGGDSSLVAADLLSNVKKVYANSGAFAALKEDNTVVTWGWAGNGGDSTGVDLTNVETISATTESFAAKKYTGEVVVWGNGQSANPSPAVQTAIASQVSKVIGNQYAFAAIKTNKTVVSWGSYNDGFTAVESSLTDVNEIYATQNAFAALNGDAVITWGNNYKGGDSSAVSSELSSGVIEVYGSEGAFAALKTGGQVVTWGDSPSIEFGGDSSLVAADLSSDVVKIFSTDRAFAALKADGSVVTWGSKSYGGDSSDVSSNLQDVVDITTTTKAFAAIKSDGSVVYWGNPYNGGLAHKNNLNLTQVKKVKSTNGAFAILKENNSAFSFGDVLYSGDFSSVASDLASDVEDIFSSGDSFAATKSDGSTVVWEVNPYNVAYTPTSNFKSIVGTGEAMAGVTDMGKVVAWGYNNAGGDISDAAPEDLSAGVDNLYATLTAFAALKTNGKVVTWGGWGGGTIPSSLTTELSSGVEKIFTSGRNFAALKNGAIYTWGGLGDNPTVAGQISSGVIDAAGTIGAFAFLKDNGSVVTWGDPVTDYGGDSSSVSDDLQSGIKKVFATQRAFAALKDDGSVITWGDPAYGGSSTEVSERLKSIKTIIATEDSFFAIKENNQLVAWGGVLDKIPLELINTQIQGNVKDVKKAGGDYLFHFIDNTAILLGSNNTNLAPDLRSAP